MENFETGIFSRTRSGRFRGLMSLVLYISMTGSFSIMYTEWDLVISVVVNLYSTIF